LICGFIPSRHHSKTCDLVNREGESLYTYTEDANDLLDSQAILLDIEKSSEFQQQVLNRLRDMFDNGILPFETRVIEYPSSIDIVIILDQPILKPTYADIKEGIKHYGVYIFQWQYHIYINHIHDLLRENQSYCHAGKKDRDLLIPHHPSDIVIKYDKNRPKRLARAKQRRQSKAKKIRISAVHHVLPFIDIVNAVLQKQYGITLQDDRPSMEELECALKLVSKITGKRIRELDGTYEGGFRYYPPRIPLDDVLKQILESPIYSGPKKHLQERDKSLKKLAKKIKRGRL